MEEESFERADLLKCDWPVGDVKASLERRGGGRWTGNVWLNDQQLNALQIRTGTTDHPGTNCTFPDGNRSFVTFWIDRASYEGSTGLHKVEVSDAGVELGPIVLPSPPDSFR